MQKAIEEAKKFVCTTKDRIVKDAKEFIQNVDWKKVAIGVAGTLAVAAVVVATGGAAAPVLIGAAVGAGIGTGTTIVSGVIQGKSPAEIAKDASGAFMWGAIGGAVGGGTAQIGTKALGKVGKKLVEDGVDMAVDLTQTATENGGLTGKDVLSSVVSSFGGDLLSSVKTNSSTKDLFALGLSDNKAVKDAVGDNVSDASKNTTKYIDTPYGRAFQENSEEALKVRKYVEDGGDLYRGGSFGRSNTTDAQFWAPESPLSPGYADKYGVDFKDTDYVIKGKLDSNADFITRSAPGLGNNSGGAIEIVTNPNSVKLDSFNMIGE